jgi:hypothetical protein
MASRQRQGFSLLRLGQAVTAVCLCIVGSARLTTVLMAPAGDYETAEWLVNYAAGFIRRGLAGELLLAVGSMTGTGALAAVKILASAALFSFLAVFARRVAKAAGLDQNEKFALLCMPSGLAFVALNGNAMLRKDWVLFLVFFGFLWLMEREGLKWRAPVFLYLAAAGSFAVLTHEIFFFLFMPYCAVILSARLADETGSLARAAGLAAAFLALPAAIAILIIATPPATGAAAAICESARAAIPSLECTPVPRSLGYLEMTTAAAIETTWSVLIGVKILGLPSIVTWVAVYLLLARVQYEIIWRMCRSQAAALLLCGMNTALLPGISLVGWDYGRWIFLLSSLATATCGSARCAPEVARLSARIGLSAEPGKLPAMSAPAYRVCVIAAGLSSIVFRLCLCCADEALDFLWPLHDLLKHYGAG